MSIRITWNKSPEPGVASYDVQTAPDLLGPWTWVINVPNLVTDPHYSAVDQQFFYVDTTGTDTTWYRLIAIDTLDNRSVPSQPFQADIAPPAVTNGVKVDHNYPTPTFLRYQTASGMPIEGAVIRAFRKADFDLGNTDAPLAITLTNAYGQWVNPLYLTTGFTYTIQFAKEGLYGPDSVEITV